MEYKTSPIRDVPLLGSFADRVWLTGKLSQCRDSNPKAAVAACNEALAVLPSSERALETRRTFMRLLAQESPVFAYELNVKALSTYGLPHDYRVKLVHETAKLAQRLNRDDDATKHFERLIRLEPNGDFQRDLQEHTLAVYRKDALDSIRKGRPESALSAFKRILEIRPSDRTAQEEYVGLVEGMDQKSAAEKDANSARKAIRAGETILSLPHIAVERRLRVLEAMARSHERIGEHEATVACCDEAALLVMGKSRLHAGSVEQHVFHALLLRMGKSYFSAGSVCDSLFYSVEQRELNRKFDAQSEDDSSSSSFGHAEQDMQRRVEKLKGLFILRETALRASGDEKGAAECARFTAEAERAAREFPKWWDARNRPPRREAERPRPSARSDARSSARSDDDSERRRDPDDGGRRTSSDGDDALLFAAAAYAFSDHGDYL